MEHQPVSVSPASLCPLWKILEREGYTQLRQDKEKTKCFFRWYISSGSALIMTERHKIGKQRCDGLLQVFGLFLSQFLFLHLKLFALSESQVIKTKYRCKTMATVVVLHASSVITYWKSAYWCMPLSPSDPVESLPWCWSKVHCPLWHFVLHRQSAIGLMAGVMAENCCWKRR